MTRGERTSSTSLFGLALAGFVLVAGSLVGGVWLYNENTLQKPLEKVLLANAQNEVIKVDVHYDGWIDTHTVVFDLTDISGNTRELDVLRVLLQYAQEQKDNRFGKVILAAFGQKKFFLTGDYFQQLGREYRTQNPIYTMRTFANHVSTLDGEKPFPEVNNGGLMGFGEELEQFNDFSKRWYVTDFVGRHK